MKRLTDEEIIKELRTRMRKIGKDMNRIENLPENNPEWYALKYLDRAYHQLEIMLDALSDLNINLKAAYSS